MSVIFDWDESEMQILLESCSRDEALPLIERHFAPPQTLLEAGCGAGRWVRFLHDRGFRITGLEYKRETVSMVHRVWPDLDIVPGDCAASPFPENHFDGALSFGVVEHWEDGPQEPLRDLFRVLKRGGKAFISVPCHNSVRKIKRVLFWKEICGLPKAVAGRIIRGNPFCRLNRGYRFAVHPAWGPFLEYRMSTEQFRAEVEDAGFEVIEHLPLGLMDGVYHELNPLLLVVGWRGWRFYPTALACGLNRLLSRRDFMHPHMQAVVVRKPF